MPGRLVDVEVDGHHRLEPGERVGQPATRRRRRHGVARDGQQCPDPALAGCGDLLGERRHGQLSPEARQAPHAGAPPTEPPGPEETPADDVDGRRREHRAARAVEVAGEHVDRLDRPLADHPVGLGRHAHPPVHGGGGRLGEFRREPPHGIRGHPGDALGELRGERVDRLADGVDAVDVGGRSSRARGQQLAHDGEQHGGVGAQAARSGARRPPGRSRSGGGRARRAGRLGPPGRDAAGGSRAPSTTSRSTPSGCARRGRAGRCRSMSGTGRRNWWPYRAQATTWWGSWSTEVAEKRFRVPSSRTRVGLWVRAPRLWTFGLPR